MQHWGPPKDERSKHPKTVFICAGMSSSALGLALLEG